MATIRAAAVGDANALFELVRVFPTPTPPSHDTFSQTLELKLGDPSACLFVAEDETRLIGYVSGFVVSPSSTV